MKLRIGFVSNSSSTSFVIYNRTSEPKSIYDFAVEVAYLVEQFNKDYDHNIEVEDFLESANGYYTIMNPHSQNFIAFGDEEGTTIGLVLDYMLRDGGDSPSFSWAFDQFFR